MQSGAVRIKKFAIFGEFGIFRAQMRGIWQGETAGGIGRRTKKTAWRQKGEGPGNTQRYPVVCRSIPATRADDAELFDAGPEGARIDTETLGRPAGAGDPPAR